MNKASARFLMLLVIAAGLAVGYLIFNTAPKPKRSAKPVQHPLVEVLSLEQSQAIVPTWKSAGLIVATDQTQLISQVVGRVIEINEQAIIGGELKKGDWLLKIEPLDYQIKVSQAKATLAQAQADFVIEQGKQTLAKEEYQLAQQTEPSDDSVTDVDLDLVLRKPYLNKAKAQRLSAQAQLKKAQLDLQRTVLTMPFNGKISQRSVNVGQYISSNSSVFEIYNDDRYWLEVSVSAKFLPVLDINKEALVSSRTSQKQFSAKILKVNHKLDEKSRQAIVLLEINPEHNQAVFLNDFVDVTLFAKQLDNSIKIPSTLLLANNKLWLVEDNQLKSVIGEPIYQGQGFVWLVNPLNDQQQILATPISYATEGMKVKLNTDTQLAIAIETAAKNIDDNAVQKAKDQSMTKETEQ